MEESTAKTQRIHGKLLAGLIACELCFVAVYATDVLLSERYWLLHALFDMDGEGTLPAWFSSGQLLLIGVLLWACAAHQVQTKRPSRAFFWLAGTGFVYLSADEASQIHERVTQWIGQRYIVWLPSFLKSHLLMTLVLLACLTLVLRWSARNLLAIWRWSPTLSGLALLGVCVTVGGGIVLESIGYKLWHEDKSSFGYKVEVAAEEFMEMLGASLVLFSTASLARSKATDSSK